MFFFVINKISVNYIKVSDTYKNTFTITIYCMKKVAIVQSREYFTPDLQDTYLEDIPLLTSDNVEKIYAFILKHAQKKCIFNFVLDIDSGVLDKLIDYISLKKKNKSKNVSILNKCIFMATRSNATSIREKKNLKDINIYFTLTTIGEVLKYYYDDRMFIVSDSTTPYYNELYSFKNNNYRIKDLTVSILNEYKGISIACALSTVDEYKKCVELILQSNYRKFLQFIEVEHLETLKPLDNKMYNLNNVYPSSGIVGNTLEYPKLAILKIYENTSLMLAYQSAHWKSFIKHKLVSKKICNYGRIISVIINNEII